MSEETKQPEALRLANALYSNDPKSPIFQAATELRRLHALNQELLEALKELVQVSAHLDACQATVEQARAALAKGASNE